MLGISYRELFLIFGATAALIGPNDLPLIARTAGRLGGRAVGYVQMVRGRFDNIMQQTQAHQVHKELQDTMAQLEIIRHEIRTMSFINPGLLTRRIENNVEPPNSTNEIESRMPDSQSGTSGPKFKDDGSTNLAVADIHGQATYNAKVAEYTSLNSGTMNNEVLKELVDEFGLVVLPVSAESSRLLPDIKDHVTGSDIILEAIIEAEVAHNAKDFFSRPENLTQHE